MEPFNDFNRLCVEKHHHCKSKPPVTTALTPRLAVTFFMAARRSTEQRSPLTASPFCRAPSSSAAGEASRTQSSGFSQEPVHFFSQGTQTPALPWQRQALEAANKYSSPGRYHCHSHNEHSFPNAITVAEINSPVMYPHGFFYF